MKSKKIMALVLAATMAAGSSMAILAADGDPANGTTGEGTLLPHLNKDIIAVTLPTEAQVASVFNYNVDPEQLINDSGKLTDGTSVTGNTDGVYFINRTGGTAAVNGTATYTSTTNTGNYTVTVNDLTVNATYTYDGTTDNQWENSDGSAATVTISITDDDDSGATVTPADGDTVSVTGGSAATSGTTGYSSTSDAVTFEGKNSVDVDVVVQAKVVKTGDGTKDITLVADDAALTAATTAKTPALLMTLDIGGTEKVITSNGLTERATLNGVAGNFTVGVENGAYKYAVKPDASGWNSTTIKLKGKTNNVDVPEGANTLTVPKIQLTWTVVKKGAEVNTAYTSATSVSSASKSVTLTMPENVSVSKVELTLNGTTTTLASGNQYTVSGSTLNFAKYATTWRGGTIKVTYSNNHVDELACE